MNPTGKLIKASGIIILLVYVNMAFSQETSPLNIKILLSDKIMKSEKLLSDNLTDKKLRSFKVSDYDSLYDAISTGKARLNGSPEDQFDAYLTLLQADKVFLENKIRNDRILFVGTGDIQQSLEKGNNIPANTGMGVTYERDFANLSHGFSKIELELSVNIASTVDSIFANSGTIGSANNSALGNSILLPINSGQAGYFDMNVYFLNNPYDERKADFLTPGIISGLNLNFVASNRNWVLDSVASNMTALSLKIGVFKEFIPFTQLREYTIKLGLRGTMNSVLGDVGQSDVLLEQFTGNTKRSYFGCEFNLGVKLKNIKAEIALPIISKGNANAVPGLTGTRIVTRVRFTGGFPISLN